jgi:hypothetical protein
MWTASRSRRSYLIHPALGSQPQRACSRQQVVSLLRSAALPLGLLISKPAAREGWRERHPW